jgi:hypothetical protein
MLQSVANRYGSWLFPLSQALLVALSLSAAHYIGFMQTMPAQVAMLGGFALASGISSTFLFYLITGLVLGRIAAYMLASLLQLEKLFIGLFFLPKSEHAKARRALREYKNSPDAFAYTRLSMQAFTTIAYMLFAYCRPPFGRGEGTIEILSAAGALALLLLAWPLLVFGFRNVIRRARNSRRTAFRTMFLRVGLLPVSGLFLLLAFLAGEQRLNYLKTTSTVSIDSNRFRGSGQVIVSAGSFLIFREPGALQRDYVVLSPDSLVRVHGTRREEAMVP